MKHVIVKEEINPYNPALEGRFCVMDIEKKEIIIRTATKEKAEEIIKKIEEHGKR